MLIFKPDAAPIAYVMFDHPPELHEVKTALEGGWLEVVPMFDSIGIHTPASDTGLVVHCVAFCDEHGKRNKAPRNAMATSAWEQACRRNGQTLTDWLAGPVVVLFGDEEFMECI